MKPPKNNRPRGDRPIGPSAPYSARPGRSAGAPEGGRTRSGPPGANRGAFGAGGPSKSGPGRGGAKTASGPARGPFRPRDDSRTSDGARPRDDSRPRPENRFRDDSRPRPQGPARDDSRPRPENRFRDDSRPRPQGPARDDSRPRPENRFRDDSRPRPQGPARDDSRPRPENRFRDDSRPRPQGPARDDSRPRPANRFRDDSRPRSEARPQTSRGPERDSYRPEKAWNAGDAEAPSAGREPRREASPAGAALAGAAPAGLSQGPYRPAAAPRGAVWLYGLHAVKAALANPARQLRRLIVTEEGAAALAEDVSAASALVPETVERARLDGMLGRDAVHQGVALLADMLAPPVLSEVLERPGPLLVLDQVTDPRNIGAILRSAAAFGVAGVIVQDRHAPEETGSLAKAASGALELVPLIRAVNIARTLAVLKAANLWTVGLDAEAATDLHGPAFAERRVALVLGGEGSGLRRLTRDSCDELVKLPMAGGMESLNVSAATAVALYEIRRGG